MKKLITWIKYQITTWLGVEEEFRKINAKLREHNKDIIACMEKDLAFQEQYPLVDDQAIQPDRQKLPDSYEYIEDAVEEKVRRGEFYVIWDFGFAGPFSTRQRAAFYAERTGVDKSKFFKIGILWKYAFAGKAEI